MAIGKMDTVIIIEFATEVKSITTGQITQSWSTFLQTWGEILPKSSTEGEKAQQISSMEEQMFRIRYESSITTKMRIYVPDLARYYDILGISMEGRKRYLLLTAKSTNVNAPA